MPNTVTGGYTLTGLLNVGVVGNGIINYKSYSMRAELNKIGSQDKDGGQITEFLAGTMGFGGEGNQNMLNCIGCTPDFEYKTNGALSLNPPAAPLLNLKGVRG